jgi:ribonuclease HII
VRLINKNHKPSFKEEKLLREQGYRLIAGVDEAGRGALMGPVVAAAVVLPDVIKARWKARVRDSKQLRATEREELYGCIREVSLSVGTGQVSHEIIDTVGIARASRLAMVAAIEQLRPEPQYILIDFFDLPETSLPNRGVEDGDSLCFSIACASIIAKVTRDRLITAMDCEYPGYGFAAHKGYSTREHLECLRRLGPCPLHRRSFAPVREIMERL